MRSYRERLRVPLLWWFLAVVNILIIGSGIWAGLGGYWPAVTYIALLVLVGAFMVNWDKAVIEVADGVLRAGRDTLRLDMISNVVALEEDQAAVLRGPRADPAAHLLLRPYLKKAVYIGLDNTAANASGTASVSGTGSAPGADAAPGGQVPYWLIATRRPAELAAAIEAAARAGSDPAGRTVG